MGEYFKPLTVECCRSGGFIAQKPIKSTTVEHSTNVHLMHVCPHFGNTMLADVIIVKQNKFLKMEQKFTPNKWQFSHREIPNDPDGMYATQVYTEDGETIATLAWYPMPQRKEIIDGEPKLVTGTYREGNARLIASAPELLKACQNALKDVQKLNKQLIEEGKHGYVLMENELNEAIKLALGS